MQLSRRAFLVVAVDGLLLGCVSAPAAAADGPAPNALAGPEISAAQDAGHDEATATEEDRHDEGEHSEPHEGTAEPEDDHGEHETGGEHEGEGGHGESGAHGSGGHDSAGPLHLIMEAIQITLAFVAVGSVVLAARIYGGEIGRALLVSGAGVTLIALERLWHNLHELGLLGAPSWIGRQGLFILATGTLAVGYLSLYQTMNKRLG